MRLDFGELSTGSVSAYTCLPMRSPEQRVLVTCPEGHEWWVKVLGDSPPQPQLVVCPLCQQSHEVLLPMIVKVEALLTTQR